MRWKLSRRDDTASDDEFRERVTTRLNFGPKPGPGATSGSAVPASAPQSPLDEDR
jgi:hypothetical protein